MKASDLTGTISVDKFNAMSHIEHLGARDETTLKNIETLRRTLFGTKPAMAASSFTTEDEYAWVRDQLLGHEEQEQYVWTGVEYLSFSEVRRMLAGIEQSINYYERCRRLGKCLARKPRKYKVRAHRRKIKRRRG